MTPQDIEEYIVNQFSHIHPKDSWGERSFFINPQNRLKNGSYFATIKMKDGDNDKASDLNRPNVFRLNIGISKPLYLDMFSTLPKRPAKGCIIEGNYDFTATNKIMPHPVYGWMAWICILNPDARSFENYKALLEDAYIKALKITAQKLGKTTF